MGLAVGAGYVEAALITTVLVIVIELVLSRFEYFIMSTARVINLYVEYRDNETLAQISEYMRSHKVNVIDLQITRSGAESKHPCAILSLELPRNLSHDRVMTALTNLAGVHSVEEL